MPPKNRKRRGAAASPERKTTQTTKSPPSKPSKSPTKKRQSDPYIKKYPARGRATSCHDDSNAATVTSPIDPITTITGDDNQSLIVEPPTYTAVEVSNANHTPPSILQHLYNKTKSLSTIIAGALPINTPVENTNNSQSTDAVARVKGARAGNSNDENSDTDDDNGSVVVDKHNTTGGRHVKRQA